MYNEFTRSMNDSERALLNSWLEITEPPFTIARTVTWICVWAGGIVLCILAAAALISLDMNPIIGILTGILIGGPLALFALFCLYAVIVLTSNHRYWSRRYKEFLRDQVPQIRRALENGKVLVKRASATAVIEIVPCEDEGPGFIYDVGNGQILFLKGQQYYPEDADTEWPNSDFEIVRTGHGNLWIGLFCHGEGLDPVREVHADDCIEDIVWAEREEILAGDMEQFAQSLIRSEQNE